jgi:AcrR family transcriptional regulator
VVQVKKGAKREAILQAAAMLFQAEDYNKSTVPKIAAAAGISTSSVYVYFNSKLDIAMTIYERWLGEHLLRLGQDLKKVKQPRKRLELILKRVWRKIPEDRNCFANNMIQAISTSDGGHRLDALIMLRSNLSSMIYTSLPKGVRSREECERLALVVIMAFDGFVINRYLPHHLVCDEETISMMCNAILSPATKSNERIVFPLKAIRA